MQTMSTVTTPPNLSGMGDVVPNGPTMVMPSALPNTLTNNRTATAQSSIGKSGTQLGGTNIAKKPKKRATRKRSNPFDPVSSSTVISSSSTTTTTTTSKNKAHLTPLIPSSSSDLNYDDTKVITSTSLPVSDDEGDVQKRRRDRNQREQERSQRIATQIADLKDLLSQSNVAFKPDKYSTLVSVHEHIESLQLKVENLDREHKGLLQTIECAGEIVNQGIVGIGGGREEQITVEQVGSSSAGQGEVGGHESDAAGIGTEGESDMGDYVQGLDYKTFFFRCTVALCVASIDGRLLECNSEFVKICGLTKEVLEASGLSNGRDAKEYSIKNETNDTCGKGGNNLVPSEKGTSTSSTVLSLFNLLSRDDMGKVFEAMSTMLRSQISDKTTQIGGGSSFLNHWTGIVDSFSAIKRKVSI